MPITRKWLNKGQKININTRGWTDGVLITPNTNSQLSKNYKLVVWNQHNGKSNNWGTKNFNVILQKNNQNVWKKACEIPWAPKRDLSKEVLLPGNILFDKLLIEVTSFEGLGGGLSEVQ